MEGDADLEPVRRKCALPNQVKKPVSAFALVKKMEKSPIQHRGYSSVEHAMRNTRSELAES